MTNFEKVTVSPEALGEFLAALSVATGPWDKDFYKRLLGVRRDATARRGECSGVEPGKAAGRNADGGASGILRKL